ACALRPYFQHAFPSTPLPHRASSPFHPTAYVGLFRGFSPHGYCASIPPGGLLLGSGVVATCSAVPRVFAAVPVSQSQNIPVGIYSQQKTFLWE
ncbi:hypothetical protein, partial [uncultured Desulfovibrio sp.]|uniref:hypothetical protein n=1 Tax=uncultured Desulfovibrio sp. TaxID=167968 RepID=UPI002601852E